MINDEAVKKAVKKATESMEKQALLSPISEEDEYQLRYIYTMAKVQPGFRSFIFTMAMVHSMCVVTRRIGMLVAGVNKLVSLLLPDHERIKSDITSELRSGLVDREKGA